MSNSVYQSVHTGAKIDEAISLVKVLIYTGDTEPEDNYLFWIDTSEEESEE